MAVADGGRAREAGGTGIALLIREACPDDAEAVAGILNRIIEAGAYTVLTTPLTVEAEREFIAGFPERGVFHVAVSQPEGRIVGLQSLEPFAGYTPALDHVATVGTFVDLATRHRGVGRRLSEATFAAAREKGFEKVLTYVRADNPAALAFYLRLGFRIVGRAERQAKIGGKYVDEIFIESQL